MAIKRRKKSKFRATTENAGGMLTKYFNDKKKARNFAKSTTKRGYSGTFSVLNTSTNKFKKVTRYGWKASKN